MDQPSGKDSFSLLYRIGFHINHTLLYFMGPAAQSPETDPQVRAKKEYERRRELHHAWKVHQRST